MRARLRCDGRFDGVRIKVRNRGCNIHEHRNGAHVTDDVGHGNKREGWDDDLVAVTDFQRTQAQVQSAVTEFTAMA